MNERGKELLVAAALRGHRQVKEKMHDPTEEEGECALGVLHLALHQTRREAMFECGGCDEREWHVREEFDITREERGRIIALNDVDGADFLTIARKCDDPDAVA